jgi:hypothetical protein
MAAKGGYDYDALVEETALDMVCLALMFFFSGLYTTVSFSIEEELHADFLLYIFSICRFILNSAIKNISLIFYP